MRLKGQKQPKGSKPRSANSGAQNDLINGGSSASCSSASAIGAHDDLDNCMDSGDDEIDVGTNADSIGFNGSQPNTSAALSGIQNDHPFANHSSNSLSPMAGASDSSAGASFSQQQSNFSEMSEADRKRAHHNALERKRRDHIKDSFHCLRDAIPNIKGEKTSRAQILKAATDYIRQMRTRNNDYQNDIDHLKKQNNEIELQIKAIEDARKSAAELLKNLNKPAGKTTSIINTGLTGKPIENATTTTSTSGTASASNNNVLVLSKPNTSVLATTTTASTPVSAASNSKKFKTIINPKNNLNFINLNTTTTGTGAKTTSLTTIANGQSSNKNNHL